MNDWRSPAVALISNTAHGELSGSLIRSIPASRRIDEVAAELGRTLDHFGVPAREKGEVLAAFAAHKGEVTEGSMASA